MGTVTGLEAKFMSWVLRTCLAVSGVEMTMKESSPNLTCMREPYLPARSRRTWCGAPPMNWCMFPMSGSFHGPGGRFRFELDWWLINLVRSLSEMYKMGRR